MRCSIRSGAGSSLSGVRLWRGVRGSKRHLAAKRGCGAVQIEWVKSALWGVLEASKRGAELLRNTKCGAFYTSGRRYAGIDSTRRHPCAASQSAK